ncbi:hypothetical protein J2X41_004177, partial [Caulobacter sp. BE254]|nr:hypothetical protein [Caulobacter sp. BE254]
ACWSNGLLAERCQLCPRTSVSYVPGLNNKAREPSVRHKGKGVVRRRAERARVAVARKLAILLHKLWQSETEFCWN